MGTFVTAQATPTLYDDKEAVPGQTAHGLTNAQVPRAVDFNVLKAALFDVRTEIRGQAIYAKHYGATFDGSTDDTAALQAALDVLSNSAGTGILVLPQTGTACVSSTLTYVGNPAYGIVVRGETGSVYTGARLKWTGSTGGTLFRTRGMCRSSFFGVTFDANDLAKYAFLAEYNSANNGGSFYNSFHRCSFANAKGVGSSAFAVGTTGVDTFQVSEFDFFSCLFSGTKANMESAFKQLINGNTKNFRFWGGSTTGCQTAFDFTYASGSYVLDGMFIGGFTVAAIKGGATGFLDLRSIEVETESTDQAYFLDGTAGGNAMSARLTTCDVNVKAPANDFVIRWYGALEIVGGQLVNQRTSGVSLPKIAIAAQSTIGSTGPGSLSTKGVYFANVTGNYAPFYDDGGNALLGTDNARLNQYQVESFGDYGGVFSSGTLTRLANVRGAHSEVGPLQAWDSEKLPTYSGRPTQVAHRYDFTYADFQAAALTKDIALIQPRDSGRERVVALYLSCGTAFAGTAGTLIARVGSTIGGQEFLKDKSVASTFDLWGKNPATDIGANFTTNLSMGAYVEGSAYHVRIRLTSSSGNLSGLSQGACTVWMVTEQLP